MHVEVSITLHTLEAGEMSHILICDLVNMCIGEIWWMLWLREICGLVYITCCEWWEFDNIHMELIF